MPESASHANPSASPSPRLDIWACNLLICMWTWYGTERGPALGWNSHGCCDTPMPQTCCWTRSRSHPEAPISGFGLTYIGRARCSAESVRSGSWIDNVRAGGWSISKLRPGMVLCWLQDAAGNISAGHGHCADIQASPLCSALLLLAWARVSASSSVEKPLQLVSLPGHTRLNHRTCCLDSNHLSHCTSGLGNYCFHFLWDNMREQITNITIMSRYISHKSIIEHRWVNWRGQSQLATLTMCVSNVDQLSIIGHSLGAKPRGPKLPVSWRCNLDAVGRTFMRLRSGRIIVRQRGPNRDTKH